MSKEKAIEAIKNWLPNVVMSLHMNNTEAIADRIIDILTDHGYMHLDDIVEGWIVEGPPDQDDMHATLRDIIERQAR